MQRYLVAAFILSIVGFHSLADRSLAALDRPGATQERETSRRGSSVENPKEHQDDVAGLTVKLQMLESSAATQKTVEDAEMANRERAFAELYTQIVAMKLSLGLGTAGPGDSLDNLYDLVQRKLQVGRIIEELKRKHEADGAKRQTEITQLKNEIDVIRKAEIKKDLADFEAIAASPYGELMMPQAWKSLISKYAVKGNLNNIKVGNVRALKMALLEPLEFVFVKGGCFPMGEAPGSGGEKMQSVQAVCVGDFYLRSMK
jgi:hypothetical protein